MTLVTFLMCFFLIRNQQNDAGAPPRNDGVSGTRGMLGPYNPGGTFGVPQSLRVACGNCNSPFSVAGDPSNSEARQNALISCLSGGTSAGAAGLIAARCPHCRKVTSVGPAYARVRLVVYGLLTLVALILAIGVTAGTAKVAQENKALYFLWSVDIPIENLRNVSVTAELASRRLIGVSVRWGTGIMEIVINNEKVHKSLSNSYADVSVPELRLPEWAAHHLSYRETWVCKTRYRLDDTVFKSIFGSGQKLRHRPRSSFPRTRSRKLKHALSVNSRPSSRQYNPTRAMITFGVLLDAFKTPKRNIRTTAERGKSFSVLRLDTRSTFGC
ncbi:transmembrane protein 55B-B [Clonorchis sinensis]|uniref:Phosphatidylinositol-4,5-bisphosphate 4-phosphatase n=1 Tax=Clonorchis sinensis TaxID=79923 RepID=G7YIY3_CLOSI|nr:transmembrane protein 55B-B [Clonorchis sinensis]